MIFHLQDMIARILNQLEMGLVTRVYQTESSTTDFRRALSRAISYDLGSRGQPHVSRPTCLFTCFKTSSSKFYITLHTFTAYILWKAYDIQIPWKYFPYTLFRTLIRQLPRMARFKKDVIAWCKHNGKTLEKAISSWMWFRRHWFPYGKEIWTHHPSSWILRDETIRLCFNKKTLRKVWETTYTEG